MEIQILKGRTFQERNTSSPVQGREWQGDWPRENQCSIVTTNTGSGARFIWISVSAPPLTGITLDVI